MNGRPFTEHEIKTIKRLAKKCTPAQIAKRLNRPPSSIHTVINSRNLPAAIPTCKKVMGSDVRKVVELRNSGLKYKEIAEQTGIDIARCGYIYRSYGCA